MRTLTASALAVAFALLGTATLRAQTTSFVHEDGTTHWYEAVRVAGGITHDEAALGAAARGGYLATVSSTEEAVVVFSVANDPAFWMQVGAERLGPWLGGLQVDTRNEPGGGWAWGELEPFAFTAWTPGQPDNDGEADRVCLGGTTALVPTWADTARDRRLPGYVVEFSGPTVPRTVGLLEQQAGSFAGYTLFNPLQATGTYLVDARGRLVNSWQSAWTPGTAVYLEADGHLLRAGRLVNSAFQGYGGDGGVLEEFDWDGNLVWEYRLSTSVEVQHHDVERLPNGHVLLIVWEKIAATAAIEAGRAPNLLPSGEVWSEKIVEVQPLGANSGRIVWEWRVWDHLVQDQDPSKANHGAVADHPERIDLNYTTNDGAADWLHFNAIAYSVELDQILVSVRNLNEIWILDHSTTRAQAATGTGGRSGRGGDLLYRWGNPQAYRAGTEADRQLYWQHDAHWIENHLPGGGHIMVFNNGGQDRPGGPHSTVDELVLPPADIGGNYPKSGSRWGPAAPVWTYAANPPSSFYSQFVSGAQRLPNGNTLVCAGWTGNMFEVTPSGQILRSYTNPISGAGTLGQGSVPAGNMVFRGPAYTTDDLALRGRTLVAGEPLESQAVVLLADGSTVARNVDLDRVVRLDLRAEAHPGAAYLVLTSLSPGVVPIDTRALRLIPDGVTTMAATGMVPSVFGNFVGLLDGQGHATATITIPWLTLLQGLAFHNAFVLVDSSAPSSLAMISNTVVVGINP
ncbi:MAG: aryl-sulfate sulfotransferase [Planctomycetota bacterium]